MSSIVRPTHLRHATRTSPVSMLLHARPRLNVRRPASDPTVTRTLDEPWCAYGCAASSNTTNTAENSVNATATVYRAVTCACLGAFLFGYHLGVVNGPLQQIAKDLAFAGDVSLQGLVVSISLAGAAVGSLSGTVLADSLGRIKAFVLDSLPLIIGSALCATSTSSTTMLVGRFVVGVGIGLSSALVPLYISEVAPTSARGKLGTINQLIICIGILGALVANVLLPVTAWRTMFWFAAIPAALLAAGILSCPESPSHLLSQGKQSEAEKAAETLWRHNYREELYGTSGVQAATRPSSKSDMEAGLIAKDSSQRASSGSSRSGTESSSSSKGRMFSGTNGKLVAIACSLFLFQQFSGINAIVYFSSSVFKDAGVGSETLASAAVGLVNVLGTLLAASLMDKAGRKQLLTVSLIGQGICMMTMAAAFVTPALKTVSGTIALVFTILYVLSFALGTGPVPGLLSAELLPTSIRGRGVSTALMTHWVCNFGIGQLFLPLVAMVGVAQVYCGFAVVSFLGALFVARVLVETKGRSADEIYKLMS